MPLASLTVSDEDGTSNLLEVTFHVSLLAMILIVSLFAAPLAAMAARSATLFTAMLKSSLSKD